MKKKYSAPSVLTVEINAQDIMNASMGQGLTYCEQGDFDLSPTYSIDQGFWDF